MLNLRSLQHYLLYFLRSLFSRQIILISPTKKGKNPSFSYIYLRISVLWRTFGGNNFLLRLNEHCNKFFIAVLNNFRQNLIDLPKNVDFGLVKDETQRNRYAHRYRINYKKLTIGYATGIR